MDGEWLGRNGAFVLWTKANGFPGGGKDEVWRRKDATARVRQTGETGTMEKKRQ
jgi:hypothetical protein